MKSVYEETCYLICDDGEPDCDIQIHGKIRDRCLSNMIRPVYNQIWINIGSPIKELILDLRIHRS